MRKLRLRRFFGEQIDPRLRGETIFVDIKERYPCVLGFGRIAVNGKATSGRPYMPEPDYFDSVPADLRPVVTAYFNKVYRNKVIFGWL